MNADNAYARDEQTWVRELRTRGTGVQTFPCGRAALYFKW